MRVIGLTGGIGSGKSTVAKFLIALGAAVIDADKVGHEALLPGSPVRDEVVTAFGKGILAPDGSINRRALAKIVFANPEELKKLNRIVHPWMYGVMQSRIDDLSRQGKKIVVVDAAVLIEAGWKPLVDEVWVTTAPTETVIKRLRAREDGPSEADALTRIRRQITNDERVKHADIVIDTDCSLAEVEAKVKTLWADLLKRTAQGDP